ncbi:ABC transporter permease [Sulfurospirillum sp. 1307]
MSNASIILAKKDIKLLFKENSFLIIFSIFMLMSALSTYIGWSTNHTIMDIYNASAIELKALNQPVPPIPFSQESLGIIKNMIIYIALIGALLSITFGHIIGINDRKAGVTRILFSNSFSKNSFLIGKSISTLSVLAIAIILSFIISIVSLFLVGVFSFTNLINVFEFYMVSFVYLAGFAFLGIYFAIKTNSSTKAILLPLLLWIVITFALPEMSSALYPTGSLNPVLPQTNLVDSPILANMHKIVYPFSISEQYKELSSNILGFSQNMPTNITRYSSFGHIGILALWFFLTLFITFRAVNKYDVSQGDDYE